MLQPVDELVDVLLRVEAKAVHARVELYVYGPARYALFLGRFHESVEQAERVDLRLKVVVEHRLERRHLRVHYHDIRRDAVATQRGTLIGHGHGEIVNAMVLQRLGNLHAARAVSVGLYHAHELGLGLHERAVIVEVGHHGVEVHLQHRLVHLLHEEVGDLVEAKLPRALDEDDLIAQRAKHRRVEKRADAAEEERVLDVYPVGIVRHHRAYADKLLHATLLCQAAHLAIEVGRVHAALLYVAEDERAATVLVVGTAVHEVEGYVERIDVGVVRVVDERAAMTALFHLKAHGYRLKLGHATLQHVGAHAKAQRHDSGDDGVLDAGIVDERNGVAALHIIIYIVDGGVGARLFHCLDKHLGIAVLARPAQFLTLVIRLRHYFFHGGVIGIVDNDLRVVEENQLLPALGLHGGEVLLMGRAEVCQHRYGRLDDVAQGKHLARLAYASLEDTNLRVVVHQPHRQWHANLRVVGTWRASHETVGREHLIEPFLHHGLAIGARDAHYWYVELVAVALCKTLQGLQGVGDFKEVALWEASLVIVGHGCYNEVAHATQVKVLDILMTVVALRLDREKQGFLGETKRTAVSKQERDIGIRCPIATRTDEGGDFLNGISHWYCFYKSAAKLIKKSIRRQAIRIKETW